MTISTTNAINDACLICHMDYTSRELEDTAKVVELACHHFYHLDCLSPWFALNENKGQDLSCCYQCTPSIVPKRSQLEIMNSETIEKRFAEIEQNQDFGSRSEVINCLAELKPHSNSIATLLHELEETEGSEESYEGLKNWIINNVQKDSRYMAYLLLSEVLSGGQTLRSLQQEIGHLASIPITKWSTEIKEDGVPVYYGEGKNEFRMCVSKDYLQRATYSYIFEENLKKIETWYHYDQEVLDCILEVKELQQSIIAIIKENASLPLEEITLSINKFVNQTQLSENSKRTIPLIINEILFQRGALRTLQEETERWKKEPIESWPIALKQNGIYYLDQKNKVMHINAEQFTGWVKAAQRAEKTLAVASEITTTIIRNTVGFLATQIFNSFG